MAKAATRDLILAGDVGGTHARFRLYDPSGRSVVHEDTLRSGSAPSLEALLGPYLERRRARVRAAAIGIAGPVEAGVSKTTNLAWVVDERKLARELDIPIVRLLNDMTAIALGSARLPAASLAPVRAGRGARHGNMAVIAAGTGLGEALLVWDGKEHVPCASEGGHADFGPRDRDEEALLEWLRGRVGPHVSYERIVSGPGLGVLYDFLAERSGARERPGVLGRLASSDRNAAIAAAGLLGRSAVAARAVEMFVSLFGAETGNLVLKGLALGGVYLGGNIARRLVPTHARRFLEAMAAKGRMRRLLVRVPVSIVLDERVGLVGAAHLAARLAAM